MKWLHRTYTVNNVTDVVKAVNLVLHSRCYCVLKARGVNSYSILINEDIRDAVDNTRAGSWNHGQGIPTAITVYA